ncbi:MAG TPA: hypothetical protein VL860_07365 [Planctomycetota bacterium]|nr:hypothetical protein [Planctomycetota bacterium]
MGLILLSSPRLDLSKSAVLLTSLPAQAGAPWVSHTAKPVVPAELRKGGFFGDNPPPLPEFTGRLQQFETAHDLGGYAACVTTAEGQPILLTGHPGPNRSVAVLLTPDWPSDDDTAAAASAAGSVTPAIGLGSLIRQAVHWTAGAETSSGEPALRIKLANDRPLPDQPVNGAIALAHLDANLVTNKTLQLVWLEPPAIPASTAPTAAPSPAAGPAPVAPAAKATTIDWQKVNGEIRFRLVFDHPGAFLVQARFANAVHTLTDQVGVYVPGEELEATEPPDHAHLQQLAEATGGRFALAGPLDPADQAALKDALVTRLTPQPSLQVGRISLGGGGATAALMIGCLLLEMLLRSRRWW